MFHLTSHGLLGKARRALESGPARSAAISAVSGGVGLISGKREDAKKVPLVAVGAGVVLNLVGLHTLGDGALAGGANIFGYRFGARMARKAAGGVSPGMPAAPHAARGNVTPGRPVVRRHRG